MANGADTLPPALRRKLNPQLRDVQAHLLEDWQPDLSDPAMRHEMLANPRLEARILADIIDCGSAALATGWEAFEDQEALARLLEPERRALILCLGCAWRGAEVAARITNGQVAQALPDVGRDVLKQALCLRNGQEQPAPADRPLAEMVAVDGLACLQSWLARLPHAVLERLKLTEPHLVPEPDFVPVPAMARLVERYLAGAADHGA